MSIDYGHTISDSQDPLLKDTRSTIAPSLHDAIECYEIYKHLRGRAKVKPLEGGVKKYLKHFIKTALQSNRYGEGHSVFLDTVIQEYSRLNGGKFPSPSILHKDGIYELATLGSTKPDESVLGPKRAAHQARREQYRDIGGDSTFTQSERRLKRGDLSNADFDLPYVRMRLCQIGQNTEPWFDKIEEDHNRKRLLNFEHELSGIEDFDIADLNDCNFGCSNAKN